jgi:hypothetical protein
MTQTLSPPQPAAGGRALAPRGSRFAAGVVLACGAGLLVGAVVFGWLLVWILVLSLLTFLAGPNAPVGLRDVPAPLLAAPSLLAALVTLWRVAPWLWRQPWAHLAHAPGPRPAEAQADDASDESVTLAEQQRQTTSGVADRAGAQLVHRGAKGNAGEWSEPAWPAPRPSGLITDEAGEWSEPAWLGTVWTALLVVLGVLGYLAYARIVFLYHRIQGAIDEGLYLYAGRLAMSGQVPYRDFYFDQAPLLPYVFGLALGPFHYDEAAARIFAIACTLLTVLVTFAAARKLGGNLAGLLAFALLLTNFDFLTELSAGVESNGSFTALVVALVGLALAYQKLGLALVLAVAAAGLRQLFIPLPIVVACYVVLAHRKPWLALLAGLVPLAVLYGVFVALGGESALLGIVRPIRSPYVVRVTADLSPLATVASFRDMLLAILPAYLPFFLYAGPAAYLVVRRGHRHAALLVALMLASLFIALANVLPYPNNPYYPITQLPLAAIVGAVSLVAVLERAASAGLRTSLVGGVGFLLLAAPLLAYRSPEYIDQFSGRPPLARFLSASQRLQQLAPPDAVLVTLETPFATQTGMRLPHGLEAGSWGVYRGISPDRARALGVVTYPMLVDMVEQGVGDVVIESDRYGFLKNYMNNDAERDRLQKALADKYELKETFGNLSDWGDVRLYLKKNGAGS